MYKPHLQRLLDLGVIERVGRSKFLVARRYYTAIGQAGEHTRRRGLDRQTNISLIVEHVKRQGKQGASFSEFQQVLPMLDRDEIRTIVQTLKRNGIIYAIGHTSAAKWYMVDDDR